MSTKDPVIEKFIKARVQLLISEAFFGTLALRLIPVDASDWCKTAATDGRHLYYNREFFDGMTIPELMFVVAHEVMHCVYDHMGMTEQLDLDKKLYNIAADFVINLELMDHGLGAMPKKIKIAGVEENFEGCYDTKYRGMHSLEIYELLKKDKNSSKYRTLDEHLEAQGSPDKNGDGGHSGDKSKQGGKPGPTPLSAEERKKIADEIKQAVREAAKAAGIEKTPGSVRGMIDEWNNPKMDWRELLLQHLQSMIKSDYTFTNPSRKGMSQGIYLPGMVKDPALEVAIAIDTSGSICEVMLKDFLNEVNGIMEAFPQYKVMIWCFDTSIHNYRVYESDAGDDLMDYVPAGGGGTLFDVNWQFMEEEDITPKRFVMFTDGYPGDNWCESRENYCDTLFLIHGNDKIEAPWGMTAHYEE